jgi:outer membrane lipoprotein LolB
MRRILGHSLMACLLGLLLVACATPQRLMPQDTLKPAEPEWHGRLSLVIHSTPETALSAGFLLRGSAHQGAIDFYSPLGTTVTALRWSPQAALWLEGDQQRSFDSLSRLTEKATGAALPIHQLFDWLEGRAVTLPGWQADLSGLQQGFLVVRRTDPAPEVVLRIKIDANP